MSEYWQSVEDAILDGRITHDVADSLSVNWRDFIGGARERASDGRWTVAVHDMIGGDMDTAPALSSVVSNRDEVAAELLTLAGRLLRNRNNSDY